MAAYGTFRTGGNVGVESKAGQADIAQFAAANRDFE
jgi:hypothetical protein